MAKPAILRTISAIKFRTGRAAKDWAEAVELLREASAAPGYTGPDLAEVVRIGEEIAETQRRIVDWTLREVVASKRGSPNADAYRAVRHVLGLPPR